MVQNLLLTSMDFRPLDFPASVQTSYPVNDLENVSEKRLTRHRNVAIPQ